MRREGIPEAWRRKLSTRAGAFLVFSANDVKLHEVSLCPDKQWRARDNSHDVTALDKMLFEQTPLGNEDKLFDVLHFRDRSRTRPNRARVCAAFLIVEKAIMGGPGGALKSGGP